MSAKVAADNMLLVNAPRTLFLVHQTKSGKEQVAAENINLALVRANMFIPLLTVLLLVRFPVRLAVENIPDVLARPALAPVLMVVQNIIRPLAHMFAKKLIQIIAINVLTTTQPSMVV